MRIRDHERGDTAFKHVSELGKGALAEAYGRYAHKLPILIRQAGLAQALAFTMAKDEGGRKLLDHLALQLQRGNLIQGSNGQALLTASMSAPLIDYQVLTQEVQACLLWYKRFAQSVLGATPDNED